MSGYLLKDKYINSRFTELNKNYENKFKYIEIKFLLEDKNWKHLLVVNKKFKEKDPLKTIYNHLKNEIGFIKNLKVYYYSKNIEEKIEINFQEDLNIIEFLEKYQINQELKNLYILKYDYSPAKSDPLYLC